MNRIVLQQVHKVLNILGVIDSHDLEFVVGVQKGLPKHEAADTSETIDTDFD